MKKHSIISFILLLSVTVLFAQQASIKATSTYETTKEELLAFKNVQELLQKFTGVDYSTYVVRSFDLTTSANGTKTKEMGPGGVWSAKQKLMIQNSSAGTIFNIENIRAMENGNKAMKQLPEVVVKIKM